MPTSNPLKLIIDANLWTNFIISRKLNLLDNLLFSGKVRLLFSKELIEEIQQTIIKPKHKIYFGSNALENMLLALEPFIDFVEIKSTIAVCRDPKDNFLLALAKDGEANYILDRR